MRNVFITLAGLICLLPASLNAAEEAQIRAPVDITSLGPQVGELVPDFSLQDQNGQVQTLDSVLGPNGAILLFHRSADW